MEHAFEACYYANFKLPPHHNRGPVSPPSPGWYTYHRAWVCSVWLNASDRREENGEGKFREEYEEKSPLNLFFSFKNRWDKNRKCLEERASKLKYDDSFEGSIERNSLDSFSNYETLCSEGVGGLCSTWLPSNKEIRIRGGKGNGNKSAIRCGNRWTRSTNSRRGSELRPIQNVQNENVVTGLSECNKLIEGSYVGNTLALLSGRCMASSSSSSFKNGHTLYESVITLRGSS